MEHDDEREFHRVYALRSVLLNMLERYPNDMSIWGALNERQCFAIARLASLCSLLEATIHNAKYTIVRAMLARAVIELNADVLTVFRSSDPEQTAGRYNVSEHTFYEKLSEKLHRVRSSGRFSKTRLRKRLFEYKAGWTETSLTKRVWMIDKGADAINWYDILSHSIHVNLSRATPEFGLFNDHLDYAISYYATTTILVTVPTGIFSKKEIEELAVFTNGIVAGVVGRK